LVVGLGLAAALVEAGGIASRTQKEVALRFQKWSLVIVPLLILFGSACSDDDSSNRSSSPPPAASSAAAQLQGRVMIDFTGAPSQRAPVSMPFAVASGAKALDAIKVAVGENNISTQEFSGLGAFVTGLFGVQAQGNNFWEFRVNGESSDVGVSSYEVKEGDVLEFRYASF
jgi:Domain of unknown function (DUF4430)